MAETRTYDPAEGDDLAKLIRAALGENPRPNEPGSRSAPSSRDADDEGDDGPTLVDLPDISF